MDDLQLREGQNVSVYQKVVDGKRERNVAFTGTILKVRGAGINKTITVKQTLEGIGVEKIFPISSPSITKIELVVEKKRHTTVKKKARKTKKK